MQKIIVRNFTFNFNFTKDIAWSCEKRFPERIFGLFCYLLIFSAIRIEWISCWFELYDSKLSWHSGKLFMLTFLRDGKGKGKLQTPLAMFMQNLSKHLFFNFFKAIHERKKILPATTMNRIGQQILNELKFTNIHLNHKSHSMIIFCANIHDEIYNPLKGSTCKKKQQSVNWKMRLSSIPSRSFKMNHKHEDSFKCHKKLTWNMQLITQHSTIQQRPEDWDQHRQPPTRVFKFPLRFS